MSENNLERLAREILTEMYNEAEPPLDFDVLESNPDSYPDDWYSQHYLPNEEQKRIFEEHIEGENLSPTERSSLHWHVILDLGPRGFERKV